MNIYFKFIIFFVLISINGCVPNNVVPESTNAVTIQKAVEELQKTIDKLNYDIDTAGLKVDELKVNANLMYGKDDEGKYSVLFLGFESTDKKEHTNAIEIVLKPKKYEEKEARDPNSGEVIEDAHIILVEAIKNAINGALNNETQQPNKLKLSQVTASLKVYVEKVRKGSGGYDDKTPIKFELTASHGKTTKQELILTIKLTRK